LCCRGTMEVWKPLRLTWDRLAGKLSGSEGEAKRFEGKRGPTEKGPDADQGLLLENI
jgi:hypothetical protein